MVALSASAGRRNSASMLMAEGHFSKVNRSDDDEHPPNINIPSPEGLADVNPPAAAPVANRLGVLSCIEAKAINLLIMIHA